MKETEVKRKISLNKMTIAKLNDFQTSSVLGGAENDGGDDAGFLSIGRRCSKANCECDIHGYTKGIFCRVDV